MEYKEIAKLDNEIKVAHDRLVELNNQYNELLTRRYNEKNNKVESVMSEKEKKLRKKDGNVKLRYWIIFLAAMLANNFINIPTLIYSGILVANVVIYFASSIRIALKIEKVKKEEMGPKSQDDIDKDELYEEVNKAREIYHNLRKKRDDEVVLVDDLDYQEYSPDVIDENQSKEEVIEEAKALTLH